MGYSIDAVTADCYDGTTCLINKFGIKNEEQLALIEADITFAKMSKLETMPLPGNFDFEHYKAIHKYLFEDLYDWAGKIRTIDISKKGTDFAKANEIESLAVKCFTRLKEHNYFKGLKLEDFASEITDFYCVSNYIHPFREGNGRTQRTFISQLVRNADYDINFSDIDNDELMISTIQAAHGVTDMLYALFLTHILKSES